MKKLLIVTQVVDTKDPVLGFFHAWIAKLAERFESVEVICLKAGEYSLPKNVHVHSLGKEEGRPTLGSLAYASRFVSLAWRLRGNYDVVFVHMNQEYVLLAGLLWKLLRKPVYLWRNHYAGSWLTGLAAFFCTNVFYTSVHSYTARFGKAVRMPVGVDTERFRAVEGVVRAPHSILFLARIAPSKRVEVLIDALALLAKEGIEFTASVVGSPLPEHDAYYQVLKEKVQTLGLSENIEFKPGVPNAQTPAIYSAHEIFVNTSPSGMFDKTMFEAAACGCAVLSSSDDWAARAGAQGHFVDAASLREALKRALTKQSVSTAKQVLEENSLAALVVRLQKVLTDEKVSRQKNKELLRKGVWTVLFYLSRFLPHHPRMVVLLYHSISDTDDFFAVSPQKFESQMAYIKKQYEVVPLSRAFEHAAGNRVQRDSVAITFDDGYQDFADNAFPILKRYKLPATVFLIGGNPDRKELGNELPLISKEGASIFKDTLIDVGSHGATHRKITRLTESEAQDELEKSRASIESLSGVRTDFFSYPKGSTNNKVQAFVKASGYQGAVSVNERGVRKGDNMYALPRIQIDRSTTGKVFQAKLTSAADWYYRLWKLVTSI